MEANTALAADNARLEVRRGCTPAGAHTQTRLPEAADTPRVPCLMFNALAQSLNPPPSLSAHLSYSRPL